MGEIREVSGVKILQFNAPLIYLNIERFRQGLLDKCSFYNFFLNFKINITKNTGDNENQKGPTKWCQIPTRSSNSIADSQPSLPTTETSRTASMNTISTEITITTNNDSNQHTKYVILDCSAMSYVDASGAEVLRDIVAEIEGNIQAQVGIFFKLI